MYGSCVFQRSILIENSFYQTLLKETKVVLSTDNTTKPHVESLPYIPLLFLLFTPTFFIIIWAIAAFIVPSNVRKLHQNRKVISNRFKQVPCKTCRFFDGNYYLNCAVRPSTVLTKKALNCSDYLQNSRIIEFKKQ